MYLYTSCRCLHVVYVVYLVIHDPGRGHLDIFLSWVECSTLNVVDQVKMSMAAAKKKPSTRVWRLVVGLSV